MRESYSYIEVLLGLREEYLKNELELRKLKEYTELYDDKIADYYFRCVSSYANYLVLDRDVIKSRFKQLIEMIDNRIDLSSVDECQKDASGNYVIKEGVYKLPTITDQESFNEQADKILNSDFKNNSTNRFVPIINGSAHFMCNSICLDKDNYKKSCTYFSKNDILKIGSSSRITDQNLLYMLDSPIYLANLNDWQREVLERNCDQIGDIVYPEISKRCRKLNLSIEKDKNKVYLKQI